MTVALVAAVGVGGLWMLNQGAETTEAGEAVAFNQDVWTANRGIFDDSNARDEMIGAALKQIKEGMSEAEVLAELGEPDDRSATKWTYSAGPRDGFPTDEFVLNVAFADGKVTKAFSTFAANLR